jgi:hypothetical protein
MTNQDCIFEREIQDAKSSASRSKSQSRLDLFLISPFGYPYDELFSEVIRPSAHSAHLTIKRADRAFQLGFVMCQRICKLIREAKYVMADITEFNPNVYYELGLAWGFGKKVLLLRDMDRKDEEFEPVWTHYGKSIISYKDDLLPLRGCSDEDKSKSIGRLLEKHIDLDKTYKMIENRKPSSYISGKRVCLCLSRDVSDNKFYESEIHGVAESLSTPWQVDSFPICTQLLTGPLDPTLADSKIWIVDVTHYSSNIDPLMYFTLGLAHSLGRETIPITNKSRCSDISPFDVRGLWQIYFERLKTLRDEFKSILAVIDETYDREMHEYPLRFVWDQILEPHGRLEVFTCARGAKGPPKSAGGRTNVDKWDYISVAELSFFLAQKYKQAEIRIRPPEEKGLINIHDSSETAKLKMQIEDVLWKTSDSVIIIGSPDVSDYAEVVLAKAYGIEPYKIEDCLVSEITEQRKCWRCRAHRENSAIQCIGKRGYLFYKHTASNATGKGDQSAFFFMPPADERECVVWYGKQYECHHTKKGDMAEGTTYGVLTIIKDGHHLFGQNRWIILLSGYTGIGTYGLAKILTQGDEMKEQLAAHQINLEHQGCQFLVSIDYESDSTDAAKKDTRRPQEGDNTFYSIVGAEPFFHPRSAQAKKHIGSFKQRRREQANPPVVCVAP